VSVHAHACRCEDYLAQNPARAREDELVRRAQAGDGDAFGQLYVRHADDVRTLIGVRAEDRATAEDIASDTWVHAWKSLPRFDLHRGPGFGAWLAGIAKNRVANAARTRARHPQLPLLDHAGARGAPAEDAAIARAEMEQVKTLLDQLAPIERAAIVLQVTTALTDAEIAQQIGVTPRQVESARGRARESLRAAMAGGPPAPRPHRQQRRPPEQHVNYQAVRDRVLSGELSKKAAAKELGAARSSLQEALARDPIAIAAPAAPPRSLRNRPDYPAVRDRVLSGELSKKAAARELTVPWSTLRAALARDRTEMQAEAGMEAER
jgi:RNA polymerase sigma-70 factor, ECF subfamily